ncbi:MAG: amidohydrolase [Clostridia bacterium]|nr:amidohydrolase [Clostridia bacterium]
MKVIDFHTHVYPDAIAVKAAESIRVFYELEDHATMDGTVDTLLRKGRQLGVDKHVILPVAMKPDRTRNINDFILDTLQDHEEFIGFGTLHAAMDNIAAEVEYIMHKGLRGIKMHPDFQLFNIDDERLFPAYDLLQGKLPVMFHMGDPRYDYSHPARLKHLMELFPRLQVIAAHFGGYRLHKEAADLLKDKDCFFDVSSSLMFMQPGEAEHYIDFYGAERFVYGSDYPLWDPVTEMERFLQLKLSDDTREQIFYKTAQTLLGI